MTKRISCFASTTVLCCIMLVPKAVVRRPPVRTLHILHTSPARRISEKRPPQRLSPCCSMYHRTGKCAGSQRSWGWSALLPPALDPSMVSKNRLEAMRRRRDKRASERKSKEENKDSWRRWSEEEENMEKESWPTKWDYNRTKKRSDDISLDAQCVWETISWRQNIYTDKT